MLQSVERRTAALVFVSLWVTYAWFYGGSGFGQNAIFSQSRAVVEQQTLSIDSYLGNTADLSHGRGKTFPNKPPGLAILTAIPYSLVHAALGPPADAVHLTVAMYLCTIAVSATSGAAIAALLFVMMRRLGIAPRDALIWTLLGGLATPLFAYSTMLYLHVPSAFFVLLAIAIAAGLVRWPAWAAGAALGAATCMNYLSIFALIAIVPLLAPEGRRSRNLAFFAVGGIPFAILLALYQRAAFGSPLATSVATTNPAFLTEGAVLGVVGAPRLEALWGVTFSPYRGLFYMSPFLLLAAYGAVAALRARSLRPLVLATALFFVLLLAFNSSFNGWHGGYAVGARYLIPAVPLLALLGALGRPPRLLLAPLGAVALLLNLAATAVDPQPPDQLRDPFGRYLLPSLLSGSALRSDPAVPAWIRDFYTGHTSTNRVAADEMLPFQKHAPGSPANEWASFNLGEPLFGPGSLLSLLPLVALWGVFAPMLWRATPHVIANGEARGRVDERSA